MSAITFTVNYTGTPDADDILAARHIVAVENAKRAEQNVAIAAQNVQLAAQSPPGTPIPLLVILPTATNAELKAGYLTLLAAIVTTAHASYVDQAKSAAGVAARFTEAELKQIRTSLTTRLNAGESVASILTDVAS